MRAGGRVLDELQHLDPLTGAAIEAEPPPMRGVPIRVPLARWAFAAGVVASTIVAVYSITQHRAAKDVDRLWGTARAERQALVGLVMELYRTEEVARLSGPEDHGLLLEARAASAIETRARLQRVESDLRELRVLDGDLDRVRDLLTERLTTWSAEIDEYASGSRIFLDDDVGDELLGPVGEVEKRWRVRDEPGDATVADLPAIAVLRRLARPVDAPVPAVVTALSSSGHRLDADLSTGDVTISKLDRPPPLGQGSARDLRVGGDRLTLLHGISLVALPLEAGPASDHLGLFYVPPSDSSQTWVVEHDDLTAVARSLDDPTRRFVVPPRWSVVGALREALVLSRFPDQEHDVGYGELALHDLGTGRRETIDEDGGDVLGVGAGTIVWARGRDTISVRSGGVTRSVDLPDRWSAGHRVRVADDGTLAVPLSRHGPNGESTTAIALLDPTSDRLRIVAERNGTDAELCWAGDWLFWRVGVLGYGGGITAHHPGTGRTLSVRLPQAVQTFVARGI